MTPPARLNGLSLSLCTAVLISAAPLLWAGSIEKIPATAEDLARELGIELEKFEAKFDTPVYATLRLTWKQPGSPEAKALEHSSPDPAQVYQIQYVKKDFGQMQLRTGGNNAKQVKDVIEMNVKFGNTGFFYRDTNPFANLKAGETFQTWTKQQSREPLPLDTAIPLHITAGPNDPAKPTKNLNEEYRMAPAFIALTVTFSRQAPAPASPAPAPAAPAAAKPR
jgi:hypothetical protein